MSDVLSLLQAVLQEGGYRTWLTPIDKRAAVCFEDDAVMGFAMLFADGGALLETWRNAEAAFLRQHGERIRLAGDKAWNVYSVFLATGTADVATSRDIRQIEEDLARTRKIAASGVTHKEALVAALLPLLPLQQQPVLDREDVAERFRRRVLAIAPSASDVVLDESVSPKDVARRLGPDK
jgi:hypothetical protein